MVCNLHCRSHWLAVGLTVYSNEFYRRGLFVWKLLLGAYSTTCRVVWLPLPSPTLHPWNGLFLPLSGLVPGYFNKGVQKHKHERRASYEIRWQPGSTCHTVMGQDISWGFKVQLLKHATWRLCPYVTSSQRIDLLFSSLNIFFGSNNTILDLSGFLKILQCFLCGSQTLESTAQTIISSGCVKIIIPWKIQKIDSRIALGRCKVCNE